MKVSNQNQSAVNSAATSNATKTAQTAATNASAKNAKTNRATSEEVKSSSQVDVSSRARDIKKASELAKADGVDEAKVARLQALIDKGEYKVDAQSVADKLVDQHLMMPS